LFKGTFKVYSGVLAAPYKEKKEERMNEVVKILEEKLGKLQSEEGKINDMEKDIMERSNMDFSNIPTDLPY
jgi:hypothetical protein